MLPAWNIGSVYFKETANGVENFVVNILVENLSVYPIKVIVSKDEKETAANIQRTEINNNVKIDVGETASIDIIYDIKNNVAPSLLVGNKFHLKKQVLTQIEIIPLPMFLKAFLLLQVLREGKIISLNPQ